MKTEKKIYSWQHDVPDMKPGRCRLYLCRHGETDYNKRMIIQGRGIDASLNDTGWAQASCLGRALQNVPVAAVYSSTLKRAIQTAQAIRMYHQHLQDDRSLLETQRVGIDEMSFGIFEGQAQASQTSGFMSIVSKWHTENAFHISFPEGESPLQVVTRGKEALHEILSAHGDQQHIVLVTHGRFLRVLLASILYSDLHQMQSLTQENTCMNIVDVDLHTNTFHEVILNDTRHLEHICIPTTKKAKESTEIEARNQYSAA